MGKNTLYSSKLTISDVGMPFIEKKATVKGKMENKNPNRSKRNWLSSNISLTARRLAIKEP